MTQKGDENHKSRVPVTRADCARGEGSPFCDKIEMNNLLTSVFIFGILGMLIIMGVNYMKLFHLSH